MNTVAKVLQHLFGALVLLVPAVALAVTYAPALENADWQAEGDIFECRLSHEIPYYGDAIFYRRAGESPRFYLNAQTSRMKAGKASLVAESPHWRPGGAKRELGLVAVKQGRRPIELAQKHSERMLSELHQGMQLVLTRQSWYARDASVQVALAPVNFQKPYQEYLGCLMELLPVNFDQVEKSKIYFPSGGQDLPVSEKRKLDNVVLYIKADPAVTSFYIDGHSDSRGSRADNLELSKMRAEMVMQYLVNKGIDPAMITTRWHGERYPVASNRTFKGRNLNRRVTLRLLKGEQGGGDTMMGSGAGGSDQARLPALSGTPKARQL